MFYVGHKVKILQAAVKVGVDSTDVGKVGTIKGIRPSNTPREWGILVQMIEVRKGRGCVCLWSTTLKRD